MANVEINDLTLKATVDTTDEFEIQETGGGSSRKTTAAGIRVTKSQVTDLVNSYGVLYEDNDSGSAIAITTAGTYYGWVSATQGEVAGSGYVTADVADVTADHLTIGASGAGKYATDVSVSMLVADTKTIKGYVFLNGSASYVGFEVENQTGGAQIFNGAASGILDLSSSDELSLRFTSDASSDSITPYRVQLSARRITG